MLGMRPHVRYRSPAAPPMTLVRMPTQGDTVAAPPDVSTRPCYREIARPFTFSAKRNCASLSPYSESALAKTTLLRSSYVDPSFEGDLLHRLRPHPRRGCAAQCRKPCSAQHRSRAASIH